MRHCRQWLESHIRKRRGTNTGELRSLYKQRGLGSSCRLALLDSNSTKFAEVIITSVLQRHIWEDTVPLVWSA